MQLRLSPFPPHCESILRGLASHDSPIRPDAGALIISQPIFESHADPRIGEGHQSGHAAGVRGNEAQNLRCAMFASS